MRAPFLARTVGALVLLLAMATAQADRRDQKAADLYEDGRKLVQAGKYKEGAEKLNAALARGATEPNELQGSESRYKAKRYDPYYWLGVAQMELGLVEQALTNFTKSETIVPDGMSKPAITGWPEEYADLRKRKAVLLARIAVPPTEVVVAAATATPVVVAVVRPTARPTEPPPPTKTEIRLAPPVTPTPPPGEPPSLAGLRTRRAELVALRSSFGFAPKAVTAALDERVASLDRTLLAKAAEPDLKKALAEERRTFGATVGASLLRLALQSGLDAYGKRHWDEVERFAELARRVSADAPQADVLSCAALASRYVLEGRKDALQIQRARAVLLDWQKKTGKKDLPVFLSPSLRDALR